MGCVRMRRLLAFCRSGDWYVVIDWHVVIVPMTAAIMNRRSDRTS